VYISTIGYYQSIWRGYINSADRTVTITRIHLAKRRKSDYKK
jgi:hypothetical protein